MFGLFKGSHPKIKAPAPEKTEVALSGALAARAERATLAASAILERNNVPVEQAARIVESLLKAGENGALAKLAMMAEEKLIPLEKSSRTYIEEADQRIGFGIEQLAASGVPQDDARSIARLLTYAGEEIFHSKVSKI